MEWMTDLGAARKGDVLALARLIDYLTPFAHSALLATTPHHMAAALMPKVFDEFARSFVSAADPQVPTLAVSIARRLAKTVAPGVEVADRSPQIHEARQLLGRLRELEPQVRERLLWRLLEGLPGPELAQVLELDPVALRADLERGVFELSRVLGHPAPPGTSDYLWDAVGTPSALVAKLEMLLPVLRYEPGSADAAAELDLSARTMVELSPVPEGKRETAPAANPAHPRFASELDEPTTGNGVPIVPPPNPFERPARTLAATDLPAEARGVLPPPELPPRPGPKLGPPPEEQVTRPIPPPASAEPTRGSGKSNPAGRRGPVPAETAVALPPVTTHQSSDAYDDLEPVPTAIGPAPTAVAVSPVAHLETRVQLEPVVAEPRTKTPSAPNKASAVAQADLRGDTRMVLDAVGDTPAEAARRRNSLFAGSTPFLIALPVLGMAVFLAWAGLFKTEESAKRNWKLVPVVVAQEDLPEGARLTLENVATRSVPQIENPNGLANEAMVPESKLNDILEGHLAQPVAAGDPIFWTQLVQDLRTQHLDVSKRFRAVSLTASITSLVGRAVKPTDHVDVLLNLTRKGAVHQAAAPRVQARNHGSAPQSYRDADERISLTLLQNVSVVATGQIIERTSEGSIADEQRNFTHVTLLLLPEEAEMLTLASSLGHVTLTLRERDDQLISDLRHPSLGVNGFTGLSTLLSGQRLHELQTKRNTVIQIIRGKAGDSTQK